MAIKRYTHPISDELSEVLDHLTGLRGVSADQLKKLEEVDVMAPYGTWLNGRYYLKDSAQSPWQELTRISKDAATTN